MIFKPKRILVIKLRHLGDVLLSSPVFTKLKESYPQAEIDAYIWKEAHSILEGHPAISGFILHDRKWKELPFGKRMVKELGLLRQIKRKQYDLVINLTEGDRGALAALISGAEVKVGVDPRKGMKRKVFTHLVKPCPTPRHAVERDLDALRVLKIFPKERELVFTIPEEAKKKAAELVKGFGPFILIHPVSRWLFKCPPPEMMARVIDLLGINVVLTGAPSERAFTEKISELSKGSVLNLAGRTSLKELGALMQLAQGMITVDSVALHMGSALKVPLVALFGPTSEENWGPWNHPHSKVVAQKLSCRPCRLDGCGGSKMSDCLWTLSPKAIVSAYTEVVASAGVASSATIPSASALLTLNSFETNVTE